MKKAIAIALVALFSTVSCTSPQAGLPLQEPRVPIIQSEVVPEVTSGIHISVQNMGDISVRRASLDEQRIQSLDENSFSIFYDRALDANGSGKIDTIRYMVVTPVGTRSIDFQIPAEHIDNFNAIPDLEAALR